MFASLNASSPRIAQSFDDTCQLYTHQQSAIHAMQCLEASQAQPIHISNSTQMQTHVGILADKPGSGKSYTMLAHIMLQPVISTCIYKPAKNIYLEYMKFSIIDSVYNNVLKTNLIIVPRCVHAQWISYCRKHCPHMNVFHVSRFTSTTAQDILQNNYDIVILHENQYKTFITDVDILHENVKFQRVIIDEVDTISISGFVMPHTNFVWMITASPDRVFDGDMQSAGIKRMSHGLGVVCSGINIVVRNDDQFIDESLLLPQYNETVHRVHCHFSAVKNLLPGPVVSALNAGDVHGAITLAGCSTASSDDGVIAAINARIDVKLELLKKSIETASEESISIINRRIRDLEQEKINVIERVTYCDCCPISMDEITNKAIVPCCKRSFEFSNLARALCRSSTCPLCRTPITMDQVIVKPQDNMPDTTTISKTKFSVLVDSLKSIFAADKQARILLCSLYNMEHYSLLLKNNNIKFASLQGTSEQIRKTVERFERGDTNVLLLDARHFGTGVNLQCASHIITVHAMCKNTYRQLVGRAQRPGRSGPLNVINILYHDENIDFPNGSNEAAGVSYNTTNHSV